MEKPVPIFLFSMVRSGSTLLQRILATHSKIDSAFEPWILLPLMYLTKSGGVISEYGSNNTRNHVKHLISQFPNKDQDYYKQVNMFAKNFYGLLSDENTTYFVDKTPRYLLIIPEIIEAFPEAKFIFLLRNPIQIYASIISSFGDGKFKCLSRFNLFNELTFGPKLLSEGMKLLKDNAVIVRYEDLVNKPKPELENILKYLNLDYEDPMLSDFHQRDYQQILVDRDNPPETYNKVSNVTLEKWKKTFNTRYRKRILTSYLKRLDNTILVNLGYDKAELLKELDGLKFDGHYNLIRDLIDYNRSLFVSKFARLYFT